MTSIRRKRVNLFFYVKGDNCLSITLQRTVQSNGRVHVTLARDPEQHRIEVCLKYI